MNISSLLWEKMYRHDSRDEFFRSPTGALPAGSDVCLRLWTEEDSPVPIVRMWHGVEKRTPMFLLGMYQGHAIWEITIQMPKIPCLFWYYFELGNGRYYGNNEERLAGIGQTWSYQPPSYQITVYDPAFTTPRWMQEGIMYQIFVDRFFNGKPDGSYLARRENITIHTDWYEPPNALVDSHSGDHIATDFFGGNLPGITQKLPYLKDMGVTVLYLNPIFKANSNHKYDTGDYMSIDPMFGDEEDFITLCKEAQKLGMRVMLDGVFSHTGEDSLYFNRYGRYDSIGAYQSKESPYASWYSFNDFPNEYECWWGIPTLPNVHEMQPSYVDYIIKGEDAVVAKWIKGGASGWRLDVADELPYPFLQMLRARVKQEDPNAVVLGEVWEDASNKVAYGETRSYCLGDSLDSVMNYPLRDACIEFLRGWQNAQHTTEILDALYENYPKPFAYALMNMLGSHDRPRILNVLADFEGAEMKHEQKRGQSIPREKRVSAMKKLKQMLLITVSMPGMPCVYYGDEVGLEGMGDPFSRACFPWGKEDKALQSFFASTLALRKDHVALRTGDMTLLAPQEDVLVIIRKTRNGTDVFGQKAKDDTVVSIVNRANRTSHVAIPQCLLKTHILTCGRAVIPASNGYFTLSIPSQGLLIALGSH